MSFRFFTETTIPRSLGEVFEFFSDARNLEAITPPWLRFRIETPEPIEMGEGTVIDYRLRIRGFPVRWRTRIVAWNPPHSFVDSQIRGPYREWVHQHTFRETSEGVHMTDEVHYDFFGGRLLHAWLVRPDIERIFAFRAQRLHEILAPE